MDTPITDGGKYETFKKVSDPLSRLLIKQDEYDMVLSSGKSIP